MNATPTYKHDIYVSDMSAKGSRLVMGTSGLGGVWGVVKQEESIDCIMYALSNGVTSFDTAPSYGNAELYLGQALRRWSGNPPFISTKVGRLKSNHAFDARLDYSLKSMKDSLKRSLDLLGVKNVSLLFLHEPQWVPLDQVDRILDFLMSLKEEGLTDMLGIGGNPSAGFMPYVSKRYFDAISIFCRMDACNLSAFHDILPICKEQQVSVYAASALHFGLLGNRYEQFITQDPGYNEISATDIRSAIKVNLIASRVGMSLSTLAQRFLFSVAEATRVVVGAQSMVQIASTLSDWNAGALDRTLFDEITKVITTEGNKTT